MSNHWIIGCNKWLFFRQNPSNNKLWSRNVELQEHSRRHIREGHAVHRHRLLLLFIKISRYVGHLLHGVQEKEFSHIFPSRLAPHLSAIRRMAIHEIQSMYALINSILYSIN